MIQFRRRRTIKETHLSFVCEKSQLINFVLQGHVRVIKSSAPTAAGYQRVTPVGVEERRLKTVMIILLFILFLLFIVYIPHPVFDLTKVSIIHSTG